MGKRQTICRRKLRTWARVITRLLFVREESRLRRADGQPRVALRFVEILRSDRRFSRLLLAIDQRFGAAVARLEYVRLSAAAHADQRAHRHQVGPARAAGGDLLKID